MQFQSSFKVVSGGFQHFHVFYGNFKSVSRVFQRSFKEVLWKFQRCFKKVQRCFKKVLWVLQVNFKDLYRSFKEVSRKFLKCLIEFKALMRMFQGCSVFLSLVLHVTHRSYPIRRRACLPQIWTQTFWQKILLGENLSFTYKFFVSRISLTLVFWAQNNSG